MAKQTNEELHLEAMTRYDASYAAEQDERNKCIDDMRFAFVPGAQWDSEEGSRKNRPVFEINKIAQPLNQLIGEQRQNRISIKVRANKGKTSKDIADVYSGLIRRIESSSNFNDVKDTAFKEMSSGGIGAWYVATDYESDNSFDQEIRIKPIHSAASSVFYDPASKDELKRDAMWIMVTQDMSRKLFNKKWPDATESSLPVLNTGKNVNGWQSRDTVRIADYWVKEPYTVDMVLMSDGQVLELDKETKTVLDELEAQGITVEQTRSRTKHRVVMYKISGGSILEGPHAWAGQYIPVIPVFGYNIWINGNHYYKGMVRAAKDPQRVYNYATSEAIAVTAISPKDPYWITVKQAQGHENALRLFNVKNSPFMFYNSDESTPGPPARSGAPAVQNALIGQIQQASMDIQATTGQHQPSLGEAVGDQSGRAILALQRKGSESTNELLDNLKKAVEYTGKIIVDLIPYIYDTERTVAVLDEETNSKDVTLNQRVVDTQTGEEVIVNNLSAGEYDVLSTAGPSFATQRSEGLNFLTKLADTSPVFAELATDLIAQSVDFPFAEELTRRVRKGMIASGVVEPTEEEIAALEASGGLQPSLTEKLNSDLLRFTVEEQAGRVDAIELENEKLAMENNHLQIKLARELELLGVKTNKTQADTDKTVADTEGKRVDTQKVLTDVLQTKTELGMPVEPAEIAARMRNMKAINDSLEATNSEVEDILGPQDQS